MANLTLFARSFALTLPVRVAGTTMTPRYVTQGRQNQGEAEQIIWTVDVTNWGSSPSAPAAEALDITNNNQVVTSTVFPTNTPSALANVITLSALKNLIAGHLYRIEVSFVIGGNTEECFFEVLGED